MSEYAQMNFRLPAVCCSASLRRSVLMLCVVAFWLLIGASSKAAEVSMTESQVKALCLLNFAKYVVWPGNEGTNSIRIAVFSRTRLAGDVRNAVRGKVIDGRAVEVLEINTGAEAKGCHILFVGSNERDISEALEIVKELPVLTVGEGESFVTGGGIISFVPRDNKVRFEVNLSAARRSRLQISSKLLTLADKVHGKQQP